MHANELPRAVAAAVSTAAALGLDAEDTAVLHNSNRIAVRLQPCGVLARVAPVEHRAGAEFEVAIARRLSRTDAPVARLEPRTEPRVHLRDGYAITLWTYYEPPPSPGIAPSDYALALARLHAGMRRIGAPAPHFTDRVAQALQVVDNPARSPELDHGDRRLLSGTLTDLSRAIADRAADTQLLHGEPHPGNLLDTATGPLFTDLETCCRGPVEFDLAHAPEPVAAHYPGAGPDLLRDCRTLTLAIATAWRWDRGDQLPDGRRLAAEWLAQIRTALAEDGPNPQR